MGEAAGHDASAALVRLAGDVALDHRGVARALVMRCPDGCGEILSINLDSRAGKAWRTDKRGGALTLYPSVWRDQGCRAHFIVWRDHLIWCDGHDRAPWRDDDLLSRVREKLASRPKEFQHFETMSAELGENPWEVLWACQLLRARGQAEKQGEERFRPAGNPERASRRGVWA